ncbi:MAG: SUMF1/EgtB/PvdO family nonheme iron enzyme [Acidobacteriota bacterium]
MTEQRGEMIAAMNASREATLDLFAWVREESTTRRTPNPGFRPILWHLAHIGAFEEWWLLIRLCNEEPIIPRYQVLFDPIRTPREESENLPARPEIESYLSKIRDGVKRNYLEPSGTCPSPPAGLDVEYVLGLVLEHEYQHQETLAYLLQMLPPESKRRPVRQPPPVVETVARIQNSMVLIEGGEFVLGATGERFSYDNEHPEHVVDVAAFSMARYPVTNGEFLEFINAEGYGERGYWSEVGWAWKQENRINSPLYWNHGAAWQSSEMFETYRIRPDYPVTGVSWYEAEAFARFAGKRLPTEAEWEKAASFDRKTGSKLLFPWGSEPPGIRHCNFGGRFLGTTPVGVFPGGASPSGCLDMAGNVWEWTATTFDGYPGFKAYPYSEYSELWFDGDHRVLKGGSWMTMAPLLRTSFRNFFRPGFRFAFAGFRLAS